MIRKLTASIYTYLPLGLRAVNNFARIVREEMDRAGAIEIFMPAVQSGNLEKAETICAGPEAMEASPDCAANGTEGSDQPGRMWTNSLPTTSC